jgi:hypothetical protein
MGKTLLYLFLLATPIHEIISLFLNVETSFFALLGKKKLFSANIKGVQQQTGDFSYFC